MADTERGVTRENIVDAALALAAREGWEAVRLHQVASACGTGLDGIRTHFAEKDRIIDAWLDRADAAMLAHVDSGNLNGLPPHERIRQLILAWLEALQPHRRVTREMIAHKLEFGHLHVQLPALLRISRTVQWMREGAMLDAPLPRRALEETAMTALFVRTFLGWLRDESTGTRRTRERLERDLRFIEAVARRVPGGRFSGQPLEGSGDPAGAADQAGSSTPAFGDSSPRSG